MLVLFAAGDFVAKFIFGTIVFVLSLFLILLVLVQRGKGGGLTGALGGMGGQSAFGTKAGDMFTRVTIITAAIWILTCWFAGKYFSLGSTQILGSGGSRSTINAVEGGADTKTSGKGGAGKEAGKETDEKTTEGKDDSKATDDKSPGIKAGGDDDAKTSDESSTEKASTESSDAAADNTKTDASKETSTEESK